MPISTFDSDRWHSFEDIKILFRRPICQHQFVRTSLPTETFGSWYHNGNAGVTFRGVPWIPSSLKRHFASTDQVTCHQKLVDDDLEFRSSGSSGYTILNCLRLSSSAQAFFSSACGASSSPGDWTFPQSCGTSECGLKSGQEREE